MTWTFGDQLALEGMLESTTKPHPRQTTENQKDSSIHKRLFSNHSELAPTNPMCSEEKTETNRSTDFEVNRRIEQNQGADEC